MDHISKALERATSERLSVRGWVQPLAPDMGRPTPVELPERRVAVSRAHLKAHHILSGRSEEDPVVSDRYRLLRTRIGQVMRQEGWSSLGITSPGSQAGKTLTSLNLAISAARDSSFTVVLIDADLRKPSIATDLGIDVERGLIDYLKGECSIDDMLVRPDFENLIIVPGRRSDSDVVPELLTSPRMKQLVDSVRGRDSSRVVVVDLPPALVGDDVVALAPLLDALLLVVSEGQTLIDELRQASELLKNFQLIGTVLNKSSNGTRHIDGYYHAVSA